MARVLCLALALALVGACGASSSSSALRREAHGGAASGPAPELTRAPIERDAIDPAAVERDASEPEPASAERAVSSVDAPDGAASEEDPPSIAPVITGASRHRLVLFTFDDGPHGHYTPRVLDVLEREQIRALFFVVPGRIARGGPRADEEAALLREIAARGHWIGSHTQDHEHLNTLDEIAVREQIVSSEATLEEVLGVRPTIFRPPGGARSEASDRILAERGYSQWLWTLVSGDFLTTDPDRVLSIFQRSVRGRERRGLPGGIVLLHDTHRWTAEALPELIAYLWRRNCALYRAGEELYDPSPDPAWYLEAQSELVEPPAAELEAHQAALRARAAERCGVSGS